LFKQAGNGVWPDRGAMLGSHVQLFPFPSHAGTDSFTNRSDYLKARPAPKAYMTTKRFRLFHRFRSLSKSIEFNPGLQSEGDESPLFSAQYANKGRDIRPLSEEVSKGGCL